MPRSYLLKAGYMDMDPSACFRNLIYKFPLKKSDKKLALKSLCKITAPKFVTTDIRGYGGGYRKKFATYLLEITASAI